MHNNHSHKEGFHKVNAFFAALASWSFRHRWLVFSGCMMVLVGALYYVQSVRMDNSFEAFFDESDPAYNAYNIYRENFGSDEIVYIMYDASNYEYGVFNKEIIKLTHSLTQAIETEVPFVKKVRSITNSELMTGNEDELIIQKIEEELPLEQDALTRFAEAFAKKPLYVNNLFNKPQTMGAILVEMTLSSTDPVEKIKLDPNEGDDLDNLYPQVSKQALDKVLSRPEFAKLTYYLSGDVFINAEYNRIAYEEMLSLGGLTFLIVALILVLFFKGRIIGVVGPLMVVFLSIMLTAAFVSAMNWHIDMLFGLTPALLTAIGVANSVHIISEFINHFHESGSREKAIHKTLYLVGTPCLLTSITTAAGFFSMSVAPIKSVSHMAVYMAIGVLFAFFLSITLLTFFLSFIRLPKHETKPPSLLVKNILSKSSVIPIHHKLKVIVCFTLMVSICGAGLMHLNVDSNFLSDFSDRVKVKKDTETIDDIMGGMNSFTYLLDAQTEGGIKEPDFLKELEALQLETEKHFPLIRKTSSIVDLIKDINQSFHGDNPAYYKIPDSRDLIAQYLLVYELSGGEEIYNYITRDQSQAVLELRVQVTNSSKLAEFDRQIQTYLDQHPLKQAELSKTGIGALWLQLMDYISDSQLKGLTIALIVITLLISFIFGSLKMGIVSMIPNIGPIIIVAGIMGWLGIDLDYSKLLLATVAIGIAVDDTIHMMNRFQLEFQRLGNYVEAFKCTIEEVGKALIITSVTLVFGWSALLLSLMDSQVWFAVLLSSTIILALLCDFFVMPVLIFWLKPFGKEQATEKS